MSSLLESVIVNASGGALASLKFNGKSDSFQSWKLRVLGHVDAQEWGPAEVIEVPLAGSEEDVRVLLNGSKVLVVADGDVVDELNPVAMLNDNAPPASGSSVSSSASSSNALKKVVKLSKKEQEAVQLSVKKSRKAYTFLLGCLQEAQLLLVNHLPRGDAYGVWKVLLARYERKTVASCHQTRSKFLQASMEKGEKVDSFLSRVMELEMRLKQMGAKVSEDELLFVVLEGLPAPFKMTVASLRMKNDLTLEEAMRHIRDHEERYMNVREEKLKEEAAHFARQGYVGGGGNGGTNNRFNNQQRPSFRQESSSSSNGNTGSNHPTTTRVIGPCHLCSKPGHVMFDCELLPKSTMKCKRCRRLGHVEATCRSSSGGGGRGGGGFNRGGGSFGNGNRNRFGNGKNGSGQETTAAAATGVEEENDEDGDEEEWGAYAACESEEEEDEEEAGRQYVGSKKKMKLHVKFTKVDAAALSATKVSSNSNVPTPCSSLLSASVWSSGPPSWILDTGCTKHLCKDVSLLTQVQDIKPVTVRVASNHKVVLNQGGHARLSGGGVNGVGILLKDVVYDHSLAANLLSVVKMVDAGAEVLFTKKEAIVKRAGKIVAFVPRRGNLYVWPHSKVPMKNEEHGQAFSADIDVSEPVQARINYTK